MEAEAEDRWPLNTPFQLSVYFGTTAHNRVAHLRIPMGRREMRASPHPLTFNVSGHFGATGEQLWYTNGGVELRTYRLKTALVALTISTRWQRVLISGMIRFPSF